MICDLIRIINEKKAINIYGAGKRANRLLQLLDDCSLRRIISCFVVKDSSDNPEDIEGIPVLEINDERIDRTGSYTIIALADKEVAKEVREELLRNGYTNVTYFSSEAYEFPEYMAAKEYLESLDDRVVVTKKAHDEFGFCHLGIDDKYLWRFYYTRLQKMVTVREDLFPENRLLEEYENGYGEYLPLHEVLKEREKTKPNNINGEKSEIKVNIYRAYGEFDKHPLKINAPEYVIPIQLGAAFGEGKICDITDDTGDNISRLNKDFSECTALYWIWKNDKEADYVGLFHYARFMDVTEDELSLLDKAGIDIVVTTPMLVGKPIKEFFCPGYIPQKDWRLMEQALIRQRPDYEETLRKYNNAFCYPGANLSIMRKKIFDEYAEFAFSITLDIAEYYEKNGIVRNDRYAGYLMENLLAIFVMHNKDKYKIATTDFLFAKEWIW